MRIGDSSQCNEEIVKNLKLHLSVQILLLLNFEMCISMSVIIVTVI